MRKTLVLTWTGRNVMTGAPEKRAAVWCNRASRKRTEEAITYAMTLENGMVHVAPVGRRWTLAEYRGE
jgi:hypothetical protein